MPWPENVELVVGTLKDVRRVRVLEGEEDEDDREGPGARGAGRRKKAAAGAGAGAAGEGSEVTDLTLDDSDGEASCGFYDGGGGDSDAAVRAMGVRIAASLEAAPAGGGPPAAPAARRAPCALCDDAIADDALVSACALCRTRFHATCLARAMLAGARAPPERLLPFGDGMPSPRWSCVECGGGVGWRDAMEAGLGRAARGRKRRRR